VHGFQIAPFLPESVRALDRIVGFVCARTGWRPPSPAPVAATPPSTRGAR